MANDQPTASPTFWLPPLRDITPALDASTIPPGVDKRDFLGKLWALVFLGAVAKSPAPVPWPDALKATREAGVPEDWFRNMVKAANRAGSLIGPHRVDGQDVLEIGPNYSPDQADPILHEFARVVYGDLPRH